MIRVLAGSTLGGLVIGAPLAAEAKKGGKGKGKGKKGKKAKNKKNNKQGENANGQEKVLICHKGKTIEVARPAVQAHINHGDTEGACAAESTCLPVTGTEGEVTPAGEGHYTATTTGATGYGNLVFDVPDGTTFAQLSTLESDFNFTLGACGVGSPRFVVFLVDGHCPYAQFPPTACDTEVQGETGNLIGNDTEFVWNDDLCGGDQTISTYAEAVAVYGGTEIESILLVTDASGGEKTVTLSPCIMLAQS